MASIGTLVKDIYEELENRGGWDKAVTDYFIELMTDFAEQRREHQEEDQRHERGTLRLSSLGTPCKRKLWYQINTPEERESIPPYALLKFNYGDIIEALVLALAKAAGHDVQGEQDELYVNGIRGHRDAVIDGVTVDVKSTSTYGYKKFEAGGLRDDDPFGYVSQLSSYVYAGRDHEVESHPSLGAFIAIDKQNGHICLDMYDFGPELDSKEQEVEDLKAMVDQPEPPERAFSEEPEGKSGNMKLPMACGYCDYKRKCWTFRTFLYSNGPKFLTSVAKEPKVPEVK